MKTQEWIDTNYTKGGPIVLFNKLTEELAEELRTQSFYRSPDDRARIGAIQGALHVLNKRADTIDDTVVQNLPTKFQQIEQIYPELLEQEQYTRQQVDNPQPRRWYPPGDPLHDPKYTPPNPLHGPTYSSSLGKKTERMDANSNYGVNFHFN